MSAPPTDRSRDPCATAFDRSEDNPFNWSRFRKWRVTLLACYVTFVVGINSTSITAFTSRTNAEFGISDAHFANSYWPVTAWNVSAAVVPMIVLPLLEEHGLRVGYLAVVQNFTTLIVVRVFAGGAAGVLQDVMDCIIADVWVGAQQRSLPVTVYVTALLTGVSFGPVFGGAVISTLDWRWCLYIQIIVYVISLVPIWFYFEETRNSVLAHKFYALREPHIVPTETEKEEDEAAEKSNLARFLYDAVVLPSYLLCTEPVVFFFTLLSAFSYGLLFLGTQSVTQVYMALYGFQEYQTGLVQASFVIGELLGFIACLWQNKIFSARVESTNEPVSSLNTNVAESRLYASIPGTFIGLAGGLFFYGWTSSADLKWVLPSIGLAWMGAGSVIVMQAIMAYITDAYEKWAGSASSAVCFGENIFAAFLPLAAQSMYTVLGFQWASSLLAFLGILLGLAPLLLIFKGPSIRRRSPFTRRALYE